MAIIKAVNSRASIGHAVNYITKKEKTESGLIGGFNCNPQCALDEMKSTKRAWKKTDGRQYKHFIQSFPKDEIITLEEANQIARELVESWKKFEGYEVCYATHKDREHIHTHIITNSVSFENGKKFNYSKKELQGFKDLSDEILKKHQKSICQKNQEITSFDMDTYRSIEKAVKRTYQSWMLDIVMAVEAVRREADSKESFCRKMLDKGIQVEWSESRKYIVFVDSNGNKVRDKRLSKIFKTSIDKESLKNEFEQYSRTRSGATKSGRSNREYDSRTNQYGLTHVGECQTEKTVEELRSRYQGISGGDSQVAGEERAGDLRPRQKAGGELANEVGEHLGKQSAGREHDRSRNPKVHRRNGRSR